MKRVQIKHFVDILKPFLLERCALEPAEENGVRFSQMCLIDVFLSEGNVEAARLLMETLRDKSDRIRHNYWQYKINQLN